MLKKTLLLKLLVTAFVFSGLSALSSSLIAQQDAEAIGEHPTALTYGEPMRLRWKVGATVTGSNSTCKNMIITIPIPTDWPEQSVNILSEDLPDEVRVSKYRTLDDGVRQLIVLLPSVPAKAQIELSQIYEVDVRAINGPRETASLEIPKRIEKSIRPFVGVSPDISFRNSKLRAKVKDLTREQETDWEKIKAIFDWVRAEIQIQEIETEDTVSVFRSRTASAEGKVSLFVAMCRALKVPARMVWVDGNQVAEFYLLNEDGYGTWYPCAVVGLAEFGSLSDVRVVLQKGDNIKVPEKEGPQKFVAEFAITKGKDRPSVEFIRELVVE